MVKVQCRFGAALLGAVLFMCASDAAPAQLVVNDPAANVSLLTQIANSGKQIQNDIIKLANMQTNLTCLAGGNGWVDVSSRLVDLSQKIQSAGGGRWGYLNAVLQKQFSQVQSELTMVQSLQAITNSAPGNCSNQQAQTRTMHELLAQAQELRQLWTAQLQQKQADESAAAARLHGDALGDPRSW